MLGQGQPGSNARVKIPQKVLQNSLSQAWNYCHVAVELGSGGSSFWWSLWVWMLCWELFWNLRGAVHTSESV